MQFILHTEHYKVNRIPINHDQTQPINDNRRKGASLEHAETVLLIIKNFKNVSFNIEMYSIILLNKTNANVRLKKKRIICQIKTKTFFQILDIVQNKS